MLTLTIDLEDPTERYDPDGRYVRMARHILDMCAELGCRATFFTVGHVALAVPALIKDIAAGGHEIAYHSHAHVSLTAEDPSRFRAEAAVDKNRFEQLTGQKMSGFRAPRFSVTANSLWALDIAAELGWVYSSSIMPTGISMFGVPAAPRTPFLWPNGLIELPLPVAEVLGQRLPYLGGIYFFALPYGLARLWQKRAGTDEILWTYAHPYDFDREEAFAVMPHTSLPASLILWLARRVAGRKIRKLLQDSQIGRPLRERLPTYQLTTFTGLPA